MILLLCALGVALAGKNPQLNAVHTVYLLPMGNGLDQYLATRLTETGALQVVTDPQKADAIITDRIGEGFEQKLGDLYPEEKADAEDAAEDKSNKDAIGKPYQRSNSFSRGRGTVFLVDKKTRNVIWSIYWPVRSSRPDDVNRRADRIADKLQRDIRGK